jgi:hypothetical protein
MKSQVFLLYLPRHYQSWPSLQTLEHHKNNTFNPATPAKNAGSDKVGNYNNSGLELCLRNHWAIDTFVGLNDVKDKTIDLPSRLRAIKPHVLNGFSTEGDGNYKVQGEKLWCFLCPTLHRPLKSDISLVWLPFLFQTSRLCFSI